MTDIIQYSINIYKHITYCGTISASILICYIHFFYGYIRYKFT